MILCFTKSVFSQCASSVLLTTNPVADSLGFPANTIVTFTFSILNYCSDFSLEAVIPKFGADWDSSSIQSVSQAFSIDGGGSWVFYNNVYLINNCTNYSNCFVYDRYDSFGFLDGNPGNDYGDFGNGSNAWTFSWSIKTDSTGGNIFSNGIIQIFGEVLDSSIKDFFSLSSLLYHPNCSASFSATGFFVGPQPLHLFNTSDPSSASVLWSDDNGIFSNSDTTTYLISGFSSDVCIAINDSSSCLDSICVPISICDFMSAKTFENNSTQNEFFPNPVSEILNFNYSLNQKSDCIISDIQSSKKYLLKLNEGEYKIDVSMLPSGIYFIKIFNNQDSFVSKFVKE